MKEIKEEEENLGKGEYKLPKFHTFNSAEEKEQELYKLFLKVNQDVEDMIAEIQEFKTQESK